MVARSTVQLGSGNHWAPGLRTGPGAMPPLPVYHFKWQKGRDNYLQRRAATFAENEKCDEVSMRMECEAGLRYFREHGGRIVVEDAILDFPPCSTKAPRSIGSKHRLALLSTGGTADGKTPFGVALSSAGLRIEPIMRRELARRGKRVQESQTQPCKIESLFVLAIQCAVPQGSGLLPCSNYSKDSGLKDSIWQPKPLGIDSSGREVLEYIEGRSLKRVRSNHLPASPPTGGLKI